MSVEITASMLRAHMGEYMEISAKQPVIITKHNRPTRALIDFEDLEEYERLKAHKEMQTYRAEDLPDDIKAEFEQGYQGEPTPHLDHLMD